MVFLIPAFVLILAAAIDIAKLNAQQKYVQAQADLASLSAVRRLPNSPTSRIVAKDVVRANDFYGRIQLGERDVNFGTFRYGTGLTRGADQYALGGVYAVEVVVRSRYLPILLRPFFATDALWVVRKAIAARRDVASFKLRNALLRVDSSDSIRCRKLAPDDLGERLAVAERDFGAQPNISARVASGGLSGTDELSREPSSQ
jgi:hypothetical protein